MKDSTNYVENSNLDLNFCLDFEQFGLALKYITK